MPKAPMYVIALAIYRAATDSDIVTGSEPHKAILGPQSQCTLYASRLGHLTDNLKCPKCLASPRSPSNAVNVFTSWHEEESR